MAEEIARKLADIQAWLTDHGARLDAHASAIEDHTTRIITLEETVAGLIIPRRLPLRSSTYKYKIYAEPVVGTPLTVQVKAETNAEAIKKAEKMFNTQLVKTEILSKHATNKSSSPQRYWVVRRLGVPRTDVERVMAHYGVSRETAEKMIQDVGVKRLLPPRGVRVRIPEGYEELSSSPSRWVLELYPLDVIAWRRSFIELAGKPLTPSEARLVHSFDDYLSRKGYLTSRQIEVLGEIARRHDVELPALPEVVVR